MPSPSPLLSLPATAAAESRHRPSRTLAGPQRRVSSLALLAGARELVIQHQGNEYHLRLTRNDKLILTK